MAVNPQMTEAQLCREWKKLRAKEGWDGKTWGGRMRPSGMVLDMLDIVHHLDGGAMYVEDLAGFNQAALNRLVSGKYLERYSVGGRDCVCADTKKAREFVSKYEYGIW